ncbi:MAG: efflux RND transporter periplasmic adaptor subunit [Gemmataceae bacterium]|nr:efflux RND transporter periplasmic adaptor subunit [Gemmataceae bacterium]
MRDPRIIVLAVSIIAAGCWRTEERKAPKEEAVPAKVDLVAPAEKALLRTVEQPGAVQADELASLHAKVAGYVKSVKADIDQEVEADDPLAELDIPELAEEAKEKRARLAQSVAEVTQAERALDSAKAQGDEAKAGAKKAEALHERWETEEKRVRGLIGRGVIDDQTREEARSQWKAAKAAWDEAKARVASVRATVAKAEADVEAAKAKRDVAEAEVGKADALVGYATIRAPFAGVVVSRDINRGDLVRPGAARPLFAVAKIDTVRLVAQVPEADAALAVKGGAVSITIQALGTQPLEGKISRTSFALAAGSRTLRVEIDLANEGKKLRPGMYAYARFRSALPRAWTLPASAVARLGDVEAAYRVEGGKAVQTPVETGHADGGQVQVMRWQKSASPPVWVPFDGTERVASKASGLFNGQAVEVAGK